MIQLICVAAMIALQVQCRSSNTNPSQDVIPKSPNYSDKTQWYVSNRQAAADVFYIISTETGDYQLPDGTTCHYADTYNDSVRTPMHSEMLGVDTLLSGELNYYSPYYRQCSLQTFENDSVIKARLPLALNDVRRAFKYYLENLNQGRPFVLAGFSQGAMIMLELMKEMDNATFERMIAAYAIGCTITDAMLAQNPHIVAAQGADDTGVTICYNSVRDAGCAIMGTNNAIAINPVNWCTDATPATFMTEPSPLLPIAQQKKDTLTVHLEPTSRLLMVEGYTATDYVLPLIGKQGCYHSREIWLYRQQLKDNIALRASQKQH